MRLLLLLPLLLTYLYHVSAVPSASISPAIVTTPHRQQDRFRASSQNIRVKTDRFEPLSQPQLNSNSLGQSTTVLSNQSRNLEEEKNHVDSTSHVITQLNNRSFLSIWRKIKLGTFLQQNSFLVGMACAVVLAKLYPHLGKNGGLLRPELFIGKYGVFFIFCLSGLSIELSEIRDAIINMKLNVAIQTISFLIWPYLVGIPLVRCLAQWAPHLLTKELRDGLLILTCLPCTINMAILLTGASGGNVATALCNTVLGNLLGIFMTPALLVRFFGTHINLEFSDMILKLCSKVLVPVAIGQVLRTTPMKRYYEKNKKVFKSMQEGVLNAIVWNSFCNSFSGGMGLNMKQGLHLLILLSVLHLSALKVLFHFFQWNYFQLTKGQVIAAMFCASHKTLAFGLPLIHTIFDGNVNLASYCSPIIFIHPIQLFLGSFLAPRIKQYTSS